MCKRPRRNAGMPSRFLEENEDVSKLLGSDQSMIELSADYATWLANEYQFNYAHIPITDLPGQPPELPINYEVTCQHFIERNQLPLVSRNKILKDCIMGKTYNFLEVCKEETRLRSGIGFGVKVTAETSKGTFLGIYSGKYEILNYLNQGSAYNFDLFHNYVVNASEYGNIMRFINGSQINYNTQGVLVYNDMKDDRYWPHKNPYVYIVYQTICDLYPGDFLRVDYGSDYYEIHGIINPNSLETPNNQSRRYRN